MNYLKYLFATLFLFVFQSSLFAQTVDMADNWRKEGKIGVVVTVVAIILAGLFVYLILLDRKVSKLEKEIQNKK